MPYSLPWHHEGSPGPTGSGWHRQPTPEHLSHPLGSGLSNFPESKYVTYQSANTKMDLMNFCRMNAMESQKVSFLISLLKNHE